jgi:3-hydroxyisobutyrate dehydrogenase-like beta-hydroxyacid dehydrogenase
MRAATSERGVAWRKRAEGIAGSDLIFIAVTADHGLTALDPLLPVLRAGQVAVDIDSVWPKRTRKTARRVEAQGAIHVDMAVTAPLHPNGHRIPVLLAGRELWRLRDFLAVLSFDAREVGEEPGAATAVKMVRSVFVKGLVALRAAERSGWTCNGNSGCGGAGG